MAHATSSAVMTSTYGAAMFSKRRTMSMPRKTMRMFRPQNRAKLIHSVG